MDANEKRVAELVAARKALRCAGVTTKGEPCKRHPMQGSDRCKAHAMQSSAAEGGSVDESMQKPSLPSIRQGHNADGTFAPGNSVGVKFGEGQPTNLGGRKPMAEALIRLGSEEDPLFPGMCRTDAAALALLRKAMAGDVPAFKEAAERTEGKVSQTIDVGNKDGHPFEVSDARERLASRIARLAAGAEEGPGDCGPE